MTEPTRPPLAAQIGNILPPHTHHTRNGILGGGTWTWTTPEDVWIVKLRLELLAPDNKIELRSAQLTLRVPATQDGVDTLTRILQAAAAIATDDQTTLDQAIRAANNAHHTAMEALEERDGYHDWADRLANAIANLTATDIGEHSNDNNPWANALDAASLSYSAVFADKPRRDCPYDNCDCNHADTPQEVIDNHTTPGVG